MYQEVHEDSICKFIHGYTSSKHPSKLIGRTTSPDECANIVMKKQSVANGASWDIDNQECFAEFSLSHIEMDEFSPYQTCLFNGKLSALS